MEGSALFNSGFLGAHFNWWIGQIADDSTWRGNKSDGKYQNLDKIPGWGYRYKVRIIGLHDREEESVPSDQLPWAQVMYPITAGGGQSASTTTPNLRQGNFVFGFFLDGADQQVPVIMGVLGNNAQTKLNLKTGNTKSNFAPVSGVAQGADPDPNKKTPDNKLALSPDPNPTIEHPDPNHQSVADVKRQEIYDTKITLVNPCDMTGSALKIIQVKIEELVKKINKILSTVNSYIDAATSIINNIRALIADFACQIAKYVKIIFDKMMEYIMKMINKAMAPTVQILPPNKRSLYLTIKEKIVQIIHCLFNNLINNLCGQIETHLNDKLNTQNSPDPGTTLVVPCCAAEDLAAAVIYTNQSQVDSEIQRIVSMIDNFLADVASDLSAVGGAITNISSFINGITGSLLTALNFQNLSLSVFGCDIKPKCAVSDYYNLQEGGGGLKQSQIPSKADTADKASQEQPTVQPTTASISFAQPPQSKTIPIRN